MTPPSDRPNEFWNGRAFYRDGESPAHAASRRAFRPRSITVFLETPWETAGSLLRVRLDEPRTYTYPDVLVWNERALWSDEEHDTLLDPRLLAEIVSPQTWQRDLHLKVEAYVRAPSVCDYLVLWPDCVKIHHYARSPDGQWRFRLLLSRDDTVFLAGFSMGVPVSELYRHLDVPEGAADRDLFLDQQEDED